MRAQIGISGMEGTLETEHTRCQQGRVRASFINSLSSLFRYYLFTQQAKHFQGTTCMLFETLFSPASVFLHAGQHGHLVSGQVRPAGPGTTRGHTARTAGCSHAQKQAPQNRSQQRPASGFVPRLPGVPGRRGQSRHGQNEGPRKEPGQEMCVPSSPLDMSPVGPQTVRQRLTEKVPRFSLFFIFLPSQVLP